MIVGLVKSRPPILITGSLEFGPPILIARSSHPRPSTLIAQLVKSRSPILIAGSLEFELLILNVRSSESGFPYEHEPKDDMLITKILLSIHDIHSIVSSHMFSPCD
jgi:hypothetical protein